MDMHEGADGQQLRPGAEHLRQAIICIPLGLLALIAGAAIGEDSVGMPLVLIGLLVAAVGVVRLLQGLWHRVA